MIEKYGDVAWFCWGIFFLAEIVALICFIVWGFGIAIKKIFEWLNTDYDEDEEEEE
jgi:hypothetical protein